MKQPKLIRLALTTAILTALTPLVFAADAAPDPQTQPQAPATDTVGGKENAAAKSDTQSLEGIVVTGTAAAGGVRKLDASFSIVAANAEQIKEANPKSTADLLKISPSIWPESSGGQTGANIEIAGFPGGGDAPFFTNMVNGTPLYGMPSLSFMDSSSLFRLDDTVERVEIINGGPGAVFGPGQMGATANFILRQGTAEPSGDIGLTYGNEGLVRLDGFYGFKIADGWYGSVGGFWRESDGVRDPQFKADSGGQLTATLTHDLDNGSFMLWARKLDDNNQFITPLPIIENQVGQYSEYPGFSALTDTYLSKAMQHVTIPNPAGGFENANLANGRGGDLNYFGGNYDAEWGGWSVSDKFLYDSGDLNTNALFSGPNPRPLSYYLYGCGVAQPAGFCNGSTAVDSNNLGPNGQGLPVSTNVNATYTTGGAVAPNQSVIQQGWWYIQKHLKNLNNDFRLSKEIFDGNTITAGIYLTHYTDHDNWSLGNQMLMSNTPNATPIKLNYVANGNTYNLTSPQGFVNENGNFNIVDSGTATNKAFYLSDSWKVDRWLFDVSARVESINAHQLTCNTTPTQLGTAFDLYDNAVPVCNGSNTSSQYNKTHPDFTFGLNYELADNMSAYARANTGGHFDDFDNGIRANSSSTTDQTNSNFSPMQKIRNAEAGFKYQSDMVYLDMSIYHKQFTGLQYQETTNSGVPLSAISNYGADTKGATIKGVVTPFENFRVDVTANYMDGHYTHDLSCQPYIDINGNPQCVSFNGNPLQRQPKFRYLLTPSYKVPTDWGDITAFVTYTHVGQRFEDQSGLAPLGPYQEWDFGIIAHYQQNWEFRVQGTNLTNEIGLTEGNARSFGQAAGIDNVLLARSIEGREVNFQVKYKF